MSKITDAPKTLAYPRAPDGVPAQAALPAVRAAEPVLSAAQPFEARPKNYSQIAPAVAMPSNADEAPPQVPVPSEVQQFFSGTDAQGNPREWHGRHEAWHARVLDGLELVAFHRNLLDTLKAEFPQHASTLFKGWTSLVDEDSDFPGKHLPNFKRFALGHARMMPITKFEEALRDLDTADRAVFNQLKAEFPNDLGSPLGFAEYLMNLHGEIHQSLNVTGDPLGMMDFNQNISGQSFWKLHAYLDEAWKQYAKSGLVDEAAFEKARAEQAIENVGRTIEEDTQLREQRGQPTPPLTPARSVHSRHH